jgi:hypothetical protein
MYIATATLRSFPGSFYGQGRDHDTPKLNKESPDAYEVRTWRNRLHVNDQGFVFIPAAAPLRSIQEASRFHKLQIQGKGRETYAKHFERGILITEHFVLPVKAADVKGHWQRVPASGVPGSGKAVKKCFPYIESWQAEFPIVVSDDTITPEILDEHIRIAGQFIGIGVFRPASRGWWGRFTLEKLTVE